VTNYLKNFLFIRIPLLDPDRFLNAALPLVGWIWSWVGLVLLIGAVATGLFFVVTDFEQLIAHGRSVFSRAKLMSNLPLLYASFVLVKVFHEFSHAFACKEFGRQEGTAGEVHTMGVMFLVFTPLPYMDASSAWAYRNKWRRVLVGMAGMLTELFIASLAAVVWHFAGPGVVKSIAYNVMFIASVSTVLFNGNPLLRYDAYYITSDLLEIPNLYQRSREYIYYLVKRYVWNVKQARNPGHSPGERFWLLTYGVASSLYRIFIFTMIILFLADRLPDPLFVIASGLGIAAAIVWIGTPIVKFVHYLATSHELTRVRPRAVATTLAVVLTAAGLLGLLPVGNHCRVEGVVEPVNLAFVHAAADGFVVDFLPSGRKVRPTGPPLLKAINPELTALKAKLEAQRRQLAARKRLAQTQDTAAAQVYAEQIAALDEQIARADEQLRNLTLYAPMAGTWIMPEVERLKGAYVRRGDKVGMVADLSKVIIRATAEQEDAALIVREALDAVEIRVKGRPETYFTGRRILVRPAGSVNLPSAALGYLAGGPVATSPEDRRGLRAAERFFEVHVAPDQAAAGRLLSGQRVVVRFNMPEKPLALQWWRALRQLFQRRFHV